MVVAVDHICGVHILVFVLHQQMEVVRHRFFDPDGVVLVNNLEHLRVAIVAKLKVELKPHPEMRQDSVAPVAGV